MPAAREQPKRFLNCATALAVEPRGGMQRVWKVAVTYGDGENLALYAGRLRSARELGRCIRDCWRCSASGVRQGAAVAGVGEGQVGRRIAIPPDSTLSVDPAYAPSA